MDKAYQVVYSDPPWRYDFSKSDSRQIENQYSTMATEDICAIKVPSADDAVLFLWATAPKLEDALAVMRAWGFRYVSHLVWDKVKIGMGFWARGQHELLLVGTKGNFPPPPPSMRISSVIRIKRGIHSKKPDEIRNYIAKAYPDKAKLEMFARGKYLNWDAFGNQVLSDVPINAKEQTIEERFPERVSTIVELTEGDGLFG